MDSVITGDSNGELSSRKRFQWSENCKVYTRRSKKKATQIINDRDVATTTTSSDTKNPSPTASAAFATSENPTTAPSPTEISSPTVAPAPAPSTAEVSTASTYEVPNDSHEPTKHSSLESGSVGQEPFLMETQVAEEEREQSPLREQRHSDKLADKDENSCLQHHIQEGENHQHQQLEDNNLMHDKAVRQSTGTQAGELQNHEDSSVPIHSASEQPMTVGGDVAHDLLESSPMLSEDLLNGRQEEIAEQPIGNDEDLTIVSPQVPSGNGPLNINGVVKPLEISIIDDRIRFYLTKEAAKNDVRELREKLDIELDQVRKTVKLFEEKELQLSTYNSQVSYSNHSNSREYVGSEGDTIGGYGMSLSRRGRVDMVDNMPTVRMNSGMGVIGHQQPRPMGLSRVSSDVGAVRNLDPRPYNRQLSVAVMENTHGANEFVEKEKRTPKANQYYRNSEFLLGKDRLPPESNKRMKTNNGRKHNLQNEHAYGFGFGYDKSRNQLFKSCSSLLQRLMKHKHGWVFNEPVDAKALGLIDYHDVIKHPMDLGTIKAKLSQNGYNSPRDFGEDVRLVFRNAMTYNPKGQDVHVMAEQLSQIFEERWAIIETEYNPYWKYQMYQDTGIPTTTSRKIPFQTHFPQVPVPAAQQAPIYLSAPASAPIPLYAPAAQPVAVDHLIQRHHVGRTPVPKKPKAKDLNKRDMTYEEKQRLSTNLQALPLEKLDTIVQIIKKRSTALSQHDNEIEVDIDNVDAETLWELDRFVTNYKKSLSKNKRKAELALQARMANQNAALANTTPAVANTQMESGTAFANNAAPPTAEGEKQGYNLNRSSSSSSSSSDSGSSSSDSDSDSSSADGSDAGQSPRT